MKQHIHYSYEYQTYAYHIQITDPDKNLKRHIFCPYIVVEIIIYVLSWTATSCRTICLMKTLPVCSEPIKTMYLTAASLPRGGN